MNAKKRILFVDDEPLVLQGLQRMLRPMRTEWEMGFVESGAAALERMALAAYDVVVSDMCMPGMNGAELLNEVMRRHPKTVRLILSGHADRELIMKCVGSTHQYLSKPCDAEALKATIVRTTALEGSLENEKLMALVAQIHKLPSLPSLYTEIIQCLRSPDFAMEEVGAIIAKDIAMTAKVLQLVNSAFFGLGRQISSPGEAASYLGADTLKALVLSLNVFAQFESAPVKGFSAEALWIHSLQTGAGAKAIAKTEQAAPNVVNEALVSGMLHDVGRLVLASNFADRYGLVWERAQSGGLSLSGAEQEVFGASHAEVGGYLLGLWGLPVSVVEAIALHHSPSASPGRVFCALTATHVADSLAHEAAAPGSLSRAGIDLAYLEALGLAERLPIWQQAVRESLADRHD